MKSSVLSLLAVAALVACLLPRSAAAEDKEAAPPGKTQAIPVKASQVAPVSETFLRELPATVITQVETRLAFQVAGRISRLPVDVGQVVKAGERIALLDAGDYEDAVGEAKAALAQAVARQKDAELHLRRMEKLWADQDVDISQLDKARTDARAAEDQVGMQRRRLNEAGRRLSQTDLVAPYNGIVAQRFVNVFDTVSAGQAVVLFVDLSRLRARAQLSPALAPEQDRFSDYALVIPGLNNLRLTGTLQGIGPSALSSANTYPITVTIRPPADAGLRPGMNGLLEITVRRRDQERFVQIPFSAVATDAGGQSRVWIVDEKTGTVQERKVDLGNVTATGIEVKRGLDPGEWVVTAGLLRLRPGQRVLILKHNP